MFEDINTSRFLTVNGIFLLSFTNIEPPSLDRPPSKEELQGPNSEQEKASLESSNKPK